MPRSSPLPNIIGESLPRSQQKERYVESQRGRDRWHLDKNTELPHHRGGEIRDDRDLALPEATPADLHEPQKAHEVLRLRERGSRLRWTGAHETNHALRDSRRGVLPRPVRRGR